MRSDGLLPYVLAEDPSPSPLTGHVGLLPYLDLAGVLGLLPMVDERLHVCGEQGWLDRQHVLSLLLVNLAGGGCVEDIRLLEADAGLCRFAQEAELVGLPRGTRSEMERRFRKGRSRCFPSPTRLYEYLDAFHTAPEEAKRQQGKAFIPAANAHLTGLAAVNVDLVAAVQRHVRQRQATLDIDATLIETQKAEALFCYQGFRAYQPITSYWAETGLAVRSEFRDGNVGAGFEMLRIVEESLAALPAGVETRRLRMDSAGYQHEVLQYCSRHDIEFTISNDMTKEFRAAAQAADVEWRPVTSRRGDVVQEWAEVVYVPAVTASSKISPTYRYLAVRELLRQTTLPGVAEEPEELEAPTIVCGGRSYRLRGIVTNRAEAGDELIRWHNERCGKSEEAHAVMKTDLAGGVLPSGKFGANAAWWGIMLLAYNLHAALRLLALPRALKTKRLKGIRFALIAVPARLAAHARQVCVQLAQNHPALAWLTEMRTAIGRLALAGG